MLRRENAEVRQQLLALVSAAAPPGVAGPGSAPPAAAAAAAALPASFWLEAQLKHCQRQVQLLSDALVAKGELTVDLEVVLLQLRSVENGPPAQWCRDSLRRIRSIQFGEELAQGFVDRAQHASATAGRPVRASAGAARGRCNGREPPIDAAAGPGAAAARRGTATRAAASRWGQNEKNFPGTAYQNRIGWALWKSQYFSLNLEWQMFWNGIS
jgi:hypothetical protein